MRKGNIEDASTLTAKGFDTDNSFMLVEIDGDEMRFQTISRTGQTVDEGVVMRRKEEPSPTQTSPRSSR